ncbi:MAG: cytochrome c oxidase subunit 2A [Anaerolineales bacterium]|nr:cytochrome c oxidase subunit 2A [Anaerolineales bacterium]
MAEKDKKNNDFQPKGTILILIIFLVTMIVLWGSVYWILLQRGVTL